MASAVQSLLALVIAFIMLGLGATTTRAMFKEALVHWKAPLTGFCCQFLVMPCLALGFAAALDVGSRARLGMLLVGCAPGGSTSNFFTYMSRGDVPLSITMTVFSTFACLGMMPLWLLIAGGNEEVEIDFQAVVTALLLVIIPVSIGIGTRAKSEKCAKYLEKGATGAGVVFIIMSMILGVIDEPWIFTDVGANVWVAGVIMTLVGAVLGYGIAKYGVKLPPKQVRTLALETGLQNSVVSLAVVAFTYEEDAPAAPGEKLNDFRGVAGYILIYSFFLIVDSSLMALVFNRISRGEEAAEAAAQAKGAEGAEAAEAGAASPDDVAPKIVGTNANSDEMGKEKSAPTDVM